MSRECEALGCHAAAVAIVVNASHRVPERRHVCEPHYRAAVAHGAESISAPAPAMRATKRSPPARPKKRAITAPANLPLPVGVCGCGEEKPVDAPECRRCEGRAEVETAEAQALADYGPRVPRCDVCLVAVGTIRPSGLLLCDSCALCAQATVRTVRPER